MPKLGRPKTNPLSTAEQRRRYDIANTVHYGVKLNRSTDADIIAYIERARADGIGVQTLFKQALRAMFARDPEDGE